MPREQVEWFVKESLDDNNKLHAQQSCTYYSIINADKGNYPYLSSFEQEQTWTMTRTMSYQNKRYQSSIENIHLTVPPILTILKPFVSKTSENEKIKLDRSISLLPPLPPSKQFNSLSYRANRMNMDYSKPSSQPILGTNSIGRKSQLNINSMRIMRVNGEFIVRI